MANEITGLNCSGSGSGDIKLLTELHDGIDRIKLIDEIWDEVKGMTQEMVKHNLFMETMLLDMKAQNKLLIDTIAEVTTGKKADGVDNNLIDALSSIITGKKAGDDGDNIIDALSKVITGNKLVDLDLDNNSVTDVLSKVITGKKVDELNLGHDGDIDGEYDTSLNGRLQKTTEMFTGIMVGLFTEDEIKSKLETLDINKLSSIVETLGEMDSNASFMKNNLRRNSDFSNANGNEQNTVDPLVELTRAVKSLVVQHAWQGIKSDKMGKKLGVDTDGIMSDDFYNEAKSANRKVAEDTVNQILNKDANAADNGLYPGNEDYE